MWSFRKNVGKYFANIYSYIYSVSSSSSSSSNTQNTVQKMYVSALWQIQCRHHMNDTTALCSNNASMMMLMMPLLRTTIILSQCYEIFKNLFNPVTFPSHNQNTKGWNLCAPHTLFPPTRIIAYIYITHHWWAFPIVCICVSMWVTNISERIPNTD